MGRIAFEKQMNHFSKLAYLLVDVFDQVEHFGDAWFKGACMDIVVGENLADFRGDDFESALSHNGVVYVIELSPFAYDDGLAEFNLDSSSVSEPSDIPDSTDRVAAYNDLVFGLQGSQFIKIHFDPATR